MCYCKGYLLIIEFNKSFIIIPIILVGTKLDPYDRKENCCYIIHGREQPNLKNAIFTNLLSYGIVYLKTIKEFVTLTNSNFVQLKKCCWET